MGAYILGTWNTTARQDKALSRLFNRYNTDVIRSAIQSGTIINNGGTGYSIGNILTIADTGTTITPATLSVTSINGLGAITAVSLRDIPNPGGNYTSHQAANNHATTVSPIGGTGCILNIDFYIDIPDLITKNGGILDNAVNSWRRDLEIEKLSEIQSKFSSATDNQQDSSVTAVGGVVPE